MWILKYYRFLQNIQSQSLLITKLIFDSIWIDYILLVQRGVSLTLIFVVDANSFFEVMKHLTFMKDGTDFNNIYTNKDIIKILHLLKYTIFDDVGGFILQHTA